MKILLTILLLLIVQTKSENLKIKIRGLKTDSNIEPIPCNPGTSGLNCVCPNTECLKYINKTGGCHPINCWKWNKIKTECEEDGKPFMSAIILQSIPFTGYFGSGFGNMGRWDIFGTYWLVIGCGCLCSCCMSLGASCSADEEEKSAASKLGGTCGSCLTSIALTTMWIWGIVVIANKEVDAPWTDWEGNQIYCPLVG
jgi:hypothetical protein